MAKKLPVLSATNDNSIWHMFGPPPLLPGENRADFDLLLERLVRDEKPTDTIEHAWVWDIAVFTWEIGRYRRSIVGLVNINKVRGLRIALEPLHGDENLQDLLDRWVERYPDAIEYVDTLLERAGLTMDDVTAQTMGVKIGDIERIDRIVMGLEARRITVLREIPRRRATFRALLSKAVDEIEEGEFTEVDVRSERTSGAA
ncbi:MAG: hypothetical protein Q8M24_04665 [Pseudolabrys sp.]|nr:hypothetical protein [Pseudolabrys sp.]MDP2294738.1 hypothetical protein [Pseudolabrys sp.]